MKWGDALDIEYKTNKLKNVCTNASEAQRVYGAKMAEKIHQRIDEIRASDSVEFMIANNIGRCHPLKLNREGQYAVDLVHPYRLIFIKLNEELKIVKIEDIRDYH